MAQNVARCHPLHAGVVRVGKREVVVQWTIQIDYARVHQSQNRIGKHRLAERCRLEHRFFGNRLIRLFDGITESTTPDSFSVDHCERQTRD